MTMINTKTLTTLSKVWFSKTGTKMVNTCQREKKRRGRGEGGREEREGGGVGTGRKEEN